MHFLLFLTLSAKIFTKKNSQFFRQSCKIKWSSTIVLAQSHKKRHFLAMCHILFWVKKSHDHEFETSLVSLCNHVHLGIVIVSIISQKQKKYSTVYVMCVIENLYWCLWGFNAYKYILLISSSLLLCLQGFLVTISVSVFSLFKKSNLSGVFFYVFYIHIWISKETVS